VILCTVDVSWRLFSLIHDQRQEKPVNDQGPATNIRLGKTITKLEAEEIRLGRIHSDGNGRNFMDRTPPISG
jgi:hypothetical protein